MADAEEQKDSFWDNQFDLDPGATLALVHKDDRINELPIPTNAYQIYLTQDTVIYVDPITGTILGPKAEGTLGIILYGEKAGSLGTSIARAIRIPRLLSSDILVNFHIAEISNCEGVQTEQFSNDPGLLGSLSFFRLSIPNNYTNIPEQDSNAFLGFYLSPTFQYKVCLISKDKAWPNDFDSYLKAAGKGIGDLYDMIENHTRASYRIKGRNPQHLDNLIFLPNYGNKTIEKILGSSNNAGPVFLSREKLHLTSKERYVSGWWFNLPVAIYSWMTADLQRLLTAGADHDGEFDGIANEIELLKKWRLLDWFKMFNNLTIGFYYLHTKGAIHGDPRPANIMFNIPENGDILLPASFQWIDIGLGYEVTEINPNEMGRTSITPRPLGGSRTTPFYAPERIEGNELEDADHIKLVKENDNFLLTFYFKHKTHREINRLRLRNKKGKPVNELGTLYEGDRIQVREFLFVVKEVQEFDIVISKIYEIVLDRVLIDKTIDDDSNYVFETLKSTSISRYRIFKQWSQATDIYGLGNTILYCIFMKGFLKRDELSQKLENDFKIDDMKEVEAADINPLSSRAQRESIFMGLSQTLRSKTFLVQFLKKLSENGFVQKELIWVKEVVEAKRIDSNPGKSSSELEFSKKISDIADQIIAFDYNFEYIRKGLDGRIGLMVQLVYFCLCCVWREDEWEEIKTVNTFKIAPIFQPFCKNRLKIPKVEKQGLPSKRAKDYLDLLINNVANMSTEYHNGYVIPEQIIPGSKEEQITSLINKNESLQKQIENLEQEKEKNNREKTNFQQQILVLENENNELKSEIDDFEKKKSEAVDRVMNKMTRMLDFIELSLRKYFDERKGSVILNVPGIKTSLRNAEKYLLDILNLARNERGHKNDK